MECVGVGAFQQAELELPEKMQRFHSNSMVTGKSVRSYVLWMPSPHSLPVWKKLALNVHASSWAARGTLQSRFTCLCGVAAGSPAAAICQWNKSFVCMSVFCARKMGILLNHSLLSFKFLSLILLWLIRGNPQGYPGELEIWALRDPIRNTAGYRLTLLFFSFYSYLHFSFCSSSRRKKNYQSRWQSYRE